MSGRRLLFAVIFFLLALLSFPLIMGSHIKTLYAEQINIIQTQILGNGATIKIVSYKQGLFSSYAVTEIKYADVNTPYYQSHSKPWYIHSIIKHGPIVRNATDTGYTLSYGNIMTQLSTSADTITAPINLQITSVVALSGNQWDHHYVVPPTNNLPMMTGTWNGITGDTIVNIIKQQRLTMDGKSLSGQLEMVYPSFTTYPPIIKLSPVTHTYHYDKNFNTVGAAKTNFAFDSLQVVFPDYVFKLNKASINFNYGPEANLFNYAQDLTIGSLEIPAPSPVTLVSDVKQSLVFKNLNANGIYKYYNNGQSDVGSIMSQLNSILEILTPSTSVTFTISAMTNLGGIDASIIASLKSMPTTLYDLDKVIQSTTHIRVAKNLVDTIVLTLQQTKYFNDLVQQGLILVDNQDYVFDMKVDGKQIIINGKDVTNQLPQMLQHAQYAAIPPDVVVSDVMQFLQYIAKTIDSMASNTGSYLTSNISDTTISAYAPGLLRTPWGSKMTIGNVTKTSYTITIPGVPSAICPPLKTQLASGTLFTVATACNPSADTDLVITHTIPAAPSGTISIVKATYGGNCGAKDGNSTITLSEACNAKSSCQYQVSTQRLGDPTYGCAKIYQAQWRCGSDENINSVTADAEADGKVITLSCPPAVMPQPAVPQKGAVTITVVAATYGGNCGVTNGNVTSALSKVCNSQTFCSYRISTPVLGDPAYGCPKSYQAQWRCGSDKKINSATVQGEADGRVVTLYCPVDGVTQPAKVPKGTISIVSATYGDNCGVMTGNVTLPLSQACNTKTACSYQISTQVLGDPAYGCPKSYSLKWRCGGDEKINWASVPGEADGKIIRLTCPPGQ